MLSESELRLLAEDIRSRGQLHPILTFEGKVIDGRNRLAACRRVGVEPRFEAVDVLLKVRRISPLELVVAANLRRRQLRPGQQALAAAAALPDWVQRGREISKSNLRRGPTGTESAKMPSRGASDEQLAKLFGVSSRYIRLAAELRREEPGLAHNVMQGNCTLHQAVRAMRAERIRKAEAIGLRGAPVVELLHGDARHLVPAAKRQYDLILTDPMYYARDLELWNELAKMGKLLKPGGFLAAVSGTQFLHDVIARMADSHSYLHFFWTVCLRMKGAHPRRHGLGVINTWRPILLFYAPPFGKPTTNLVDQIGITAPPIARHPMELPVEAFTPLISSLTQPGDWVLDPFAGSGSTLAAAQKLGRNSTGCELKSMHVRSIEQRLAVKAQRLRSA